MTPYQPQNVVLQTGNGNNLVTWPLVAGATSYSIQKSTDGINFSLAGTSVSPLFLDSSVVVGVNYYYQVASVNVSGTSSYSASYPVSIVPCLPGQISLGYLRYLTQLKADKLNSEYLTTDEWNSNINQSIYELRDILVTKFGDNYFFAPPLLIPLTGLDSYPLPDGSNYPVNGVPSAAIFKLSGVDANIFGASLSPNAGWVPIARFNWSDRAKYTTFPNQAGALNNIYQMGYREMGNLLYIIPANTNQVLRLWYVPIMKQLLQDTDMLDFSFSGWSEFIIVDAAMKAMIKEESLEKWNALAQSKQVLIERIETTSANRDVGEPNSVSNTRATSGDPGFTNQGFGNGMGWGGGSFAFLPIPHIFNPIFHENYLRYQCLTYSISHCNLILTILAVSICLSYLFYFFPRKFGLRKFFSFCLSSFRNHVFRVISIGAKK